MNSRPSAASTARGSDVLSGIYTVTATLIGLSLLLVAALDWIAYGEFVCSLIWR